MSVQPVGQPAPTSSQSPSHDDERSKMQALIDAQSRVIGNQASLIRYYQDLLELEE